MMVYTVLKMMQRVDGEEVDIDEYIDSKDLQGEEANGIYRKERYCLALSFV